MPTERCLLKNKTGGVHFELLHGVSFGSGALLIILIVFLYYLRLRWKKEKNYSNCSNCKQQQQQQQPPQPNRTCVIEMPRHSMEIPAPDASGPFSEASWRDYQNFLAFSKMINQPTDSSNVSADRYIVK